MASGHAAIENTIAKQWESRRTAREPCKSCRPMLENNNEETESLAPRGQESPAPYGPGTDREFQFPE
jgi:hypothetical protein